MKTWKLLGAVFIIGLLTLVITRAQTMAASPVNETTAESKASGVEVEPELLARFNEASESDYLIYFDAKADLSAAYGMDWEARGWYVMETLKATADAAQANVRAYLDAQGVAYQSFWIDNIIAVEGSTRSTLDGLLAFEEIEIIRAPRVMQVIEPVQARPASPDSPEVVEPNISHVQATAVWGMGFRGAGSVVANIDTGVRFTHQALVNQYRGNLGGNNFNHNYNWWDPYNQFNLPTDQNGHGSHTMGTMIGDDGGTNQIGMAPEAEWIACRGCSTSSCGGAELLACAQFMAAPWDLTGSNPDPSKRPYVVNNSWGDCGQSYDPWYQGVVNGWHAAGVYPVFSNGNSSNCGYPSPPGLNTVGNPARYGNVSGVGSTGTSNGQYANHSNWGPTDNLDTVNPQPGWANLKPQFLAPGVSIRSSVNTGDTAYSFFTGTSMSAPHVAGLIALMWQAAPCLVGDYATTETIIEMTATPIPYNDLGGGPRWPNFAAGWGEINALAAVTEAMNACGPFRLEATPASQDVCVPADALYTVDVLQNEPGFNQPVTLSTVGVPGGYTPSFGTNPVTPPGSSLLTLAGSNAAAFGSYAIDIVGSAITETFTTTVGLNLYTAVPGIVSLTAPANGATNIDLQPTFSWTAASQAANYTLELATDNAFSNIIYTATTEDTTYQATAVLAPLTTYYWRVTANNACGAGAVSAVYSFTTRDVPPILLVDDDDNGPDVRSYYTTILDNLGLFYDVWDTNNSDNEPTTADLAPYSMVIWFTGDEFGGAAGPGAAGEAALGSWLDDGNCLFLSSQDYYFDRGLTPFMANYLGVASMTNDNGDYTSVTGQGSVFAGLGPYPLTYPFTDWSDPVNPNATAEVAFLGNNGRNAAINKDSGVYRTAFLAYPFEAMSVAAREETMQVAVDWCGTGGDTGTLAGNVSSAVTSLGLQGATVTATDGSYSRSVTTNAAGDYSMTVPVGTYTLTAAAPNYQPVTVNNVIVLTDTTTFMNFVLDGSVLTYSPASITENMEIGDVVTNTVTVTNTGPLPIDWSVTIGNYGGPTAATRVVPLTVTPLAGETAVAPNPALSSAGRPAATTSQPMAPFADVNLVLDDGTRENSIGLTAGGQFIWLNRFTPAPGDFPFTLTEVQVLFGQAVGVNVGELVDIYIYEDTDGDGNPGTGANFLGSILNAAVQATNDVTWSVYPMTTPIVLNGPGDVLIAVVNRTAGTDPGEFAAAIDQTPPSAGRSWVGAYTGGNPGNPPTLPADDLWGTIDSFGLPGNWMVRGYGNFGTGSAWASADPNSGTIPANSVATFQVIFDATSLYQTGQYTAELSFSGTFVNEPPVMPLTMNLGCATCGFLEGAITDARTGDPLSASINVTGPGGFDVTLSGSNYGPLAVQPGSYTVTASATGYFSNSTTATVTQGQTTTANLGLTPQYGELVYSPAAIEEFMSVGEVRSNTVTVTNTGTVPFDFTVRISNYGGPTLQLRPIEISIPRFEGTLPPDTTPPTTARAPQAPDKVTNGESYPLAPLGEMAYALDVYPGNNLVMFPDADAPGSWSVIAPVLQFHPAGDFLNGDFSTLYALDYDTNQFVTINTTTGARTVIGTALGTGNWTGMTGAVDGTLYVSSSVCGTSSTLYTIDPATAQLTLVGQIGAGTCIIDIAINAEGQMYGVDIVSDTLYQIDPTTGVGTMVGPLGVNANYAQSMDFEELSGILYWAAYTSSGEMRIIDTNTGASALVGAFPGGAEVEALAFATFAGGAGGWASADPNSGTVPAGSSVTFEVIFDATSLLQVGTYTAELSFSGDFENNPPVMPLTMHLDCPTCGFIQGNITDALTGNPLVADIRVVGDGGVDVTVSGDSYYLSLPADDYELTVSASGYYSETAALTLSAGVTVTTDFALTPIFSELVYAPESFEVTIGLGTMLTQTLSLSNAGTAPFDFSLFDLQTGSPSALRSPAITCAPDAFGYTCTDSTEPDGLVAYSFEDISATGTPVVLSDDSVSGALPIGFAFNYYGTDYSNIYISSNGFLTVLPGQPNGCCTGGILPSPTAPNGVIAGWWEDLNPGAGGTIHYQTLGAAPHRYMVVQFTNVPHFGGGNLVTMQWKLFEGSNNIEVHYQAAPSDGGTHSAGIEDESGTIGLQYYRGPASLTTPLAVCYLYPGQVNCGSGGEDAIWLSQSPDAGTVNPGESFPVSVLFDASAVTEVGTYTAEIYFNGSFDNNVTPMTVIMHVEEPMAAIELDVTVSLNNTCGTADTLAVPQGSTVYYCYTVTNTGNVMLPNHTITDTVFGHIATFLYDLLPGETESVIYAQTITTDTLSIASWTAAHAGLGMSATATDEVNVTLLPSAWLRVAHLAPFAMDPGTAVTVTLNGVPTLTDFAYGDSTTYIELPPGVYLVEIFPGSSSTAAISATVTLAPDTYYTAVATGDGVNQDLELLALVDDNTAPAAGNFHLRLGHLAPFDTGTALADIRLQDGTPVLTNVAYGDVTGYILLPAGTYDLKITTPGGAVTLIDLEPVTFAAGDIVTAFATGDGSNQALGVFAWPVDVEGFFLPLTPPVIEYILYLPFITRP